MAIEEGNLDVGTSGEKLDTTKVSQTDGTEAHREAVVITDPEVLAARASVNRLADSRDFGAQVVNASDLLVTGLLEDVVAQLKILNFHMSLLTETTVSEEDINDGFN